MKLMLKRLLHRGLPIPRMLYPVIRAAYRAGVWVVEGLAFVRKLIWVEPVLRAVCSEVGAGLRAERLPYMRGHGSLTLGAAVNLSGRSCFYFVPVAGTAPTIRIGDRTFIGDACTLSAACGITIGPDCLIASCVRVHDNDGHPVDARRRLAGERLTAADCASVTIGCNVWIGAGAVILKGVTIGDHAVIGAGAVVTNPVPAGAIVAGNPARVVKALDAPV